MYLLRANCTSRVLVVVTLLGLTCSLSPLVAQATAPWIPVDATPFGKEQAIWLALDQLTAVERRFPRSLIR